jgi:hypothetical protein
MPFGYLPAIAMLAMIAGCCQRSVGERACDERERLE